MIMLRRAKERHHDQRREQEVWLTFWPQEPTGPLAGGFGSLESLSEIRLPPSGVSAAHPGQEAEIVTYTYKGTLAQGDSTGGSGMIPAGEFQRMTTGRGIRHNEKNASRSDWAHVFRISLHFSEVGLDCARDQKRFTAAQRRNVLCVVASPDGRKGSLRIVQDALVFSSVLEPGHHLVHELLPGRSAWLHVICGEATLHDTILSQGDGVGVTIERSVSLTAQERTEILLVDVGEQGPGLPRTEAPMKAGPLRMSRRSSSRIARSTSTTTASLTRAPLHLLVGPADRLCHGHHN